MRNPYEIIVWERKSSIRSAEIKIKRSFKNARTAYKWGEKINRKLCQETTYSARHRRFWVDLYKVGKGCLVEFEAVIVPSVGDLGYTP